GLSGTGAYPRAPRAGKRGGLPVREQEPGGGGRGLRGVGLPHRPPGRPGPLASRPGPRAAARHGGCVNLTPEQESLGRRNFLKALAGTPALAALGVAAATRGPMRGGRVKVAWLGVGGQGRALLTRMDPAYVDVRALCDINPTSLAKADEVL